MAVSAVSMRSILHKYTTIHHGLHLFQKPLVIRSHPALVASAVYISHHTQRAVSSQFIRFYASGRRGPKNSMEEKVISDRLLLHQALSHSEWQWPVDPKRVLVIFFPWLGAKTKHIDKYRELYTTLGLDVLTVNSVYTDFLWPPNSFKLAKHTLKALQERLEGYDHYIFHSMSIGSYNLTILCMLARKQPGFQHLVGKFKGFIFDSIVVGAGKGGVIEEIETLDAKGKPVHAMDLMVKGMAEAVSKNPIVKNLMTYTAKLYFAAFKKQTVDFYERALVVVRKEPVKVPTLVFASKDDAVSDAVVLQKLVEIWRKESNLPVTLKLWDSSPHAQHYVHHSEEYLDAQKKFLSQVFPGEAPKSKL